MPDDVSLDLTRLTDGERMLLTRRRAGWTQREAADRSTASERAWVLAELDRRPLYGRHGHTLAPPAVDGPSPAEALTLARRRSQLGLAAVAAALGVTRVTVLKMERAADPRLRAFWTAYGFRF